MLEELVGRVERWDGSVEQALELRRLALAATVAEGKLTSPAEVHLRSLMSAYKKKGLADPDKLSDPVFARVAAPFLGDPGLQPWMRDPSTLPDAVALRWLELFERHACATPDVVDFVALYLNQVPRPLWRPAARALGRMAVRATGARERLVTIWASAFPDGYQLEKGQFPRSGGTHAARHALSAACFYAADAGSGGVLQGFEPAAVAGHELPRDTADRSATLLALHALATGDTTRPLVLSNLPARLAEVIPEPQAEEALRELADALASDPAAAGAQAQVVAALVRPAWRQPGARYPNPSDRIEALWSFVETARWLAATGRQKPLRELQAAEPGLAFTVEVALGSHDWTGGPDVGTALVERLVTLLDDDLRATTAPERLALRVVELRALLECGEAAGLSWPALLRRAGKGGHPSEDFGATVSEAGMPALISLLEAKRWLPETFLRDRLLPRDLVFQLAAVDGAVVAGQVGVQLERHLRGEQPGGAIAPLSGVAQVHLLWRLCQFEPKDETLKKIRSDVRASDAAGGEASRALREAVEALMKLNRARENFEEPLERTAAKGTANAAAQAATVRALIDGLADGYESLAAAATRLVAARPGDEPPGQVQSGLRFLAGSIRRNAACLLDQAQVATEPWLSALHDLFLGDDEYPGGLDTWMKRVGGNWSGIEAHWEAFRQAVRAAVKAGDRILPGDCEAVRESLGSVSGAARKLSWTERFFVVTALRNAELWLEKRTELAERNEREKKVEDEERARRERALGEAIATRDEDAVMRFVADKERMDDLSMRLKQRTGEYLLEQYRFEDARRLRKRLGNSVELQGAVARLTPLAAAIAGNCLWLLSFAGIWNDLLNTGTARVCLTVGLALTFTFGMMAADVASRIRSPGTGALRRSARAAVRILKVFAMGFLYAIGVTALMLFALDGTSVRPEKNPPDFMLQAIMWASMNLFLGVVIDRYLKGESSLRT